MSSCICSICYEDVIPATDILQCISRCGHVFHELCLQQWIEYCPDGRTPTCPLCKQKCAAKDTSRLYFQASTDFSVKQVSPANSASRSPPSSDKETTEVDRAHIKNLEAKVQLLSNGIEFSKKRILELTEKEARNLETLQILEVERMNLKKEKGRLVEAFARTREELRRSTQSCHELSSEKVALEKDLAAHRLVVDVNLSEADVVRLAGLGSGTNKDYIIETLTKSLHLRNRTFKELMIKCQELGMGKNRAQQRSEKLAEQLKFLKARIQEMTKAQEEQENAMLRSLSGDQHLRSPSKIVMRSTTSCNHCKRAPENSVSLLLSNSVQVGESKDRGLTSPTVSLLDSAEMVKGPHEGMQLRKRHVSSIKVVPSIESSKEKLNSNERNLMGSSPPVTDYIRTQSADGHIPFMPNGFNMEPEAATYEILETEYQGLLGGAGKATAESSGLPVNREGLQRPFDGGYQDGGLLSETQNLTSKIDASHDNVEIMGCGIVSIRREKGLGQGTSFNQPQPMQGRQRCATLATASPGVSRFIVSGADGRGGRITVLKPPMGTVLSGANRSKRLKSTTQIAGSRPASLKIEHFFGRG